MMRTIEVLIVIIIITGAFIAASFFAVLPWPRQVSPMNLRRLSFTTLQMLDSNYDLSRAAFEVNNFTIWSELQVALSASLPPNVIYNLTVYEVGMGGSGSQLYNSLATISNAPSLGSTSDASSYLTASSNVTFNTVPEKIGEQGGGGTLYILNCSDANGWWITGYTAQSLADDLYKLLSPYFVKTVMVQNTDELRQLIDGDEISGDPKENVENAIIINTFGECVPMPQEYHQGYPRANQGYDAGAPSGYGYTRYCYTLGQVTRQHNWTWASIVGYPFYYVSNTAVFEDEQNGWGIYGMRMTNQGGINAFLQGLDNQQYHYDSTGVAADVGDVTLTQASLDYCNYYGIYPSPHQTSTRALSNSILSAYDLSIGFSIFNPPPHNGNYNAGAIYRHISGSSTDITGSLLALGLTRTPDIRLTGIGLLSYYHPRLYRSEYTAYGTSRLVVLQLGLVGGT
jgi:hypothetical protein